MRMAFRSFLVFGILLILASCAQIGTLSGGEKDEIAPKPIESKVEPLNGSTYFMSKTVTIPFDEYIKLNNPTDNILIVPPHAKIEATLHKKNLILNWKDTLEQNTTYTIYLNRAVKDIREGKDSLMQYVFSTGAFIDSLSYKVNVADAFTNVPISGCLVALYENKIDSVLPTYFAQADRFGWTSLKHLKKGVYSLIAFEDKNKDLLYQKTERIALRSNKISIDSSSVDSSRLRLFSPELPPNITSLKYQAPGLFEVEANRSIDNANIYLNRKKLNASEFKLLNDHKFTFLHSVKDTSVKTLEVIVQNELINDTISLRILEKEKLGKTKIANNLENLSLYEKDTLRLNFTDQILKTNASQFHLKNKKDSSEVKIVKIEENQNYLSIIFSKKGLKDVLLKVDPNGIELKDSQLKDTIKLDFTIKEEKEYGAINLDASKYTQPIVVEVLNGETVVQTIHFSSGGKKLIERLEPADYKFRVIIDQNKNGKWDTGDFNSKTQPEEIHLFLEVTKVRANWEIDLKLIPKKAYE